MEQVEPLERNSDFERPLDLRRDSATSRRRAVLGSIVLVVVAVAIALFLVRRLHPDESAVPPPQASPSTPAPAASAPASAGPQHPIEAAAVTPVEPVPPLPAVSESDGMLQDAMAAIFTAVPLDRVFHLDAIVPRFVATIDNLPRQTAALQRMPVKPIDGRLLIAQDDGRILLRADNATRYSTYMRVLDQVDTRKLVQTYVRFYPLFQKAYEDLGYPHGYFNDRLVDVIDHLLAAPDVPAPAVLTQPKVMYEFADPALEQRSAGQKILMRLGPVDEARVKAKLRDVRSALTGQALPR